MQSLLVEALDIDVS